MGAAASVGFCWPLLDVCACGMLRRAFPCRLWSWSLVRGVVSVVAEITVRTMARRRRGGPGVAMWWTVRVPGSPDLARAGLATLAVVVIWPAVSGFVASRRGREDISGTALSQ